MKILVTGGAGFIGSHVVDVYLAAGHEVAVLDNFSTGVKENIPSKVTLFEGDITDRGFVNEVIEKFRPQVINHHAAHIHVGRSVADPLFDATVNIDGTINLLQAFSRLKGDRLVIFASTGGAMYGNKQTPFNEEMMPAPLSPYGVSKRSAELYLGFYFTEYHIPYISLRYANVYGPRQNPHGEAGVVSIFSEKIINHQQPIINGDGLQTRDYVFVKDVARANLLALDCQEVGMFNIGTGIETNVNDLFNLVNREFGGQSIEAHGPARAGEQRTSSLAFDKARRILGWEPKMKLDNGIRQTIEWFKSRRQRV